MLVKSHFKSEVYASTGYEAERYFTPSGGNQNTLEQMEMEIQKTKTYNPDSLHKYTRLRSPGDVMVLHCGQSFLFPCWGRHK